MYVYEHTHVFVCPQCIRYNYSKKFDIKPPSLVTFPAKSALPSLTPMHHHRHLIPGIRDKDFRSLYATNCPDSHFQCLHDGHCLPVFVRCNGVYDCPGREDERECDQYTCPGFYRCRGTKTCLHPDHVCDRLPHCPQQDDERHCDADCPSQCTCRGLAFTCHSPFAVGVYSKLRYLDVSRSGEDPGLLANNTLLVYLNLQLCHLTSLTLPKLPNLRILDVRCSFVRLEISFFLLFLSLLFSKVSYMLLNQVSIQIEFSKQLSYNVVLISSNVSLC